MPERDEATGRFLNGNKRSTGRPRGARSKLSEAFLDDLREAWEVHGATALAKCAADQPAKFCSITASLLPKEVIVAALRVDASGADGQRHFAEAYLKLREMVGIRDDPALIEIESERRDAEMLADD
jgi:hypothetical protein